MDACLDIKCVQLLKGQNNIFLYIFIVIFNIKITKHKEIKKELPTLDKKNIQLL